MIRSADNPRFMRSVSNSLPVGTIGLDVRRELRLPLVTVAEKLLLVVQQLLTGLSGVLGVGGWKKDQLLKATGLKESRERTLNNGIHGTRLLAETAVDALGHVDIITGSPSGPVLTLLRLNGDCQRRADLQLTPHQPTPSLY